MPTRVTIVARLEETNKSLDGGQRADNRDDAIRKLIDDLCYSADLSERRLIVNTDRRLKVDGAYAAEMVSRRPIFDGQGNYLFDTIDIRLPDDLFPIHLGGLQHLVGILCDAVPSATGSIRWKDPKVTSVELSDELRNAAVARFRATAHNIEDIRSAFHLPPFRPLLAYSFKPRVGVKIGEVRQLAGDLAAAGFNIVEFDTRRLEGPGPGGAESPLNEWASIQETMNSRAAGRPVSFSPNLSMRTDIAVETAKEWCRLTSGSNGPTVIKVDGGLDGLSTIQAIRETITVNPPIITCYPLLRGSLGNALGGADGTWTELLAISGVDIIYPGGRPVFTDSRGRLVSGEGFENSVNRAQRRYKKYLDRKWPMPSFAAGPHVGDLHVAQNLLGGGTAMFLGDAVTASFLGIEEASKLIARIVDATADEFLSNEPILPTDLLVDYAKQFDADTFIAFSEVFGPGKAIPFRRLPQ